MRGFQHGRASDGRSFVPQTDEHPQPPDAHAAAVRRVNLAPFAILVILMLGCFSLASCATSQRPSSSATQSEAPSELAASVDPLIGTGKGPGGSINLFPGPTTPFGMARLSPDTESHGYGYHYYQPDIQGFSMPHGSGPGCPNEGDVFFTATTGAIETATAEFESPYSHSRESVSPGYYEVDLPRWGVKAELTATDLTGLARFTFPPRKAANVLVPISHTLNQTVGAEIRVAGDNEISGYVKSRVFAATTRLTKSISL